MKKFKLKKPLVESSIPPQNKNVFWVDVDEKTKELSSIKQFKDNNWQNVLSASGAYTSKLVSIERDEELSQTLSQTIITSEQDFRDLYRLTYNEEYEGDDTITGFYPLGVYHLKPLNFELLGLIVESGNNFLYTAPVKKEDLRRVFALYMGISMDSMIMGYLDENFFSNLDDVIYINGHLEQDEIQIHYITTTTAIFHCSEYFNSIGTVATTGTGVYRFDDVQIYDNMYSFLYKLYTDNLNDYVDFSMTNKFLSPKIAVTTFVKELPGDKDNEDVALNVEDDVDNVNEGNTNEGAINLDDVDIVVILYYNTFFSSK